MEQCPLTPLGKIIVNLRFHMQPNQKGKKKKKSKIDSETKISLSFLGKKFLSNLE
jgi:hypothetical protein